MRSLADKVCFYLALVAASTNSWLLASAVQDVFIGKVGCFPPEIRSVAIGTERDEISGEALPALYAMANKGHRRDPALCEQR